MPIAVFDIDGTLTDTMSVDVECYEAAILEVLGVTVPEHWPSMEEITDSAILASSCRAAGRPLPDAETEADIAGRVGQLLERALERSPERFRPIRGARTVFDALLRSGWRVAMATGAWRPSALVKLRAAGIPVDGIPLATSSDHPARRGIIQHAVGALALGESEPVVYVGDGVWDGRAATGLGYGFVGVAQPEGAEALVDAGAVAVVEDLADRDLLLSALRRALA